MRRKKPLFSQLTLVDRCTIEAGLNNGKSINQIAKELDKSPSTISREISKHKKARNTNTNDCEFKHGCKQKQVCKSINCIYLCKNCKHHNCREFCSDYIPTKCPDIPSCGVCNSCSKVKKTCKYQRYVYEADRAHKEYKELQSSTRTGTFLTGEELEHINNIITPLIRQGQSPYQVITAHKDELPASESTIRRLINNGDFDVRNIDLRNQVKRKKPRRRMMKNEITSIQSKLGHLYTDYLNFMNLNDVMVAQMDCVEGSKESESVLLTLHFPVFHLQLAILLPHHTSDCVIEALDKIEKILGKDLFGMIFQVILTDNGHEFNNIEAIERSVFGGKRTTVFYCEPNRAEQKGHCECNHKYIRYFIPKGTNMNNYSQNMISLMMNHINSTPRKSLGGLSPYKAAKNALPPDFFLLLGLEEIDPDDVNLTPSLIRNFSK